MADCDLTLPDKTQIVQWCDSACGMVLGGTHFKQKGE
jgi:hypothetical protein